MLFCIEYFTKKSYVWLSKYELKMESHTKQKQCGNKCITRIKRNIKQLEKIKQWLKRRGKGAEKKFYYSLHKMSFYITTHTAPTKHFLTDVFRFY